MNFLARMLLINFIRNRFAARSARRGHRLRVEAAGAAAGGPALALRRLRPPLRALEGPVSGQGHRLLPADSARRRRPHGGRDEPPPALGFALMFFFSNGLGCLPSLLVSAIGTLLLLLLTGVIDL
jgi:hypothetical protein